MDPTTNLRKQHELAHLIIKEIDTHDNPRDLTQHANELAELVIALDEWIKRGGFMPAQWSR